MEPFVTYFYTFIMGYIGIVISDFMVHRNIMHGRWKIVKRRERFFQMWLYPHYIQHLVVHHSHSVNAKSELEQGLPVPERLKEKKVKQFSHLFWPSKALGCSDHGMSIKDGVCLFSFLSLFLITPQYLLAAVLAATWGIGHGAIVIMFTLIPAYNHFHHRFYHMDSEAKKKLAPRFLRWVVLSREIEKITEEHMEHHHSQKRTDDYYNLLPFGRYILRPIFNKH